MPIPLAAIPLAKLAIPALGAGFGALSGYQKGGGRGALIGAGLGAVTPGALRFAGTALGGTAVGGAAVKGLSGARGLLGISGPTASGSKVLGGLLPAVGWGIGAPGIVGGAGAGLVGGRQGQVGGYDPTQGLPASGPMYGVGDYYNPLSSRNLGYGWQQKDFDINRKAAVDAALAMEPIIEGAKQREYLRNLGAAKYRQQVATEATLAQQGQLGAQALGRIGAQSALGALAANYQYR